MCASAAPFSARGREAARAPPYSSANHDYRLAADRRQQALQIGPPQCDATCGRREIRLCKVNEDGAAAPAHARPPVVVELDHQVIGRIGAVHALVSARHRQSDRLVIARVIGIVAPAVLRADAQDRETGARPQPPIGAPPHAHETISSARGCAVALALVIFHSSTAQRHREALRPGGDPAAPRAAGLGRETQYGERFGHDQGRGLIGLRLRFVPRMLYFAQQIWGCREAA